jgi:DNA-binding PadR family transcriptional regulator
MLDIEILAILCKEMSQTEIITGLNRKESYRPFLIKKLKLMESQGLIKVKTSKQDRRFKRYKRTRRGKVLLKFWEEVK